MRKGLYWGLSRVQEGEFWIQLGRFSEVTSSWAPSCAHWSYTISWEVRWRWDPWFPLFLPALTALRRANWNESCHQSKDKVTLHPGFVLSCICPTATSGCCYETVSIVLIKETRWSPKSLKAPMVLNNGCPLVSTTRVSGAKHFALLLSYNLHHIPEVGTIIFPIYRGEAWGSGKWKKLSRKSNKLSEDPQPSGGQSDPLRCAVDTLWPSHSHPRIWSTERATQVHTDIWTKNICDSSVCQTLETTQMEN